MDDAPQARQRREWTALMAGGYRVTTPAPRDVWWDLLGADPEAVPYQSPAWVDSIAAEGKFADASRLYETPDGRRFVLPLMRRRIPAFIADAASQPHGWGMGGLLSAEPVRPEDVRAVFADLARLPFVRISIRPNPRTAAVWAAGAPGNVTVKHRRAHVIDLSGGFEHVSTKLFARNTRTHIRKAERRGGVEVEWDDTGRLLPVFYDLLQRSFDRWAAQQHEPKFLTRLRGGARDPLSKFQSIAAHMKDACRVYVARVDGRAAAASVVLMYGNVNDSRGAMDKDIAGPAAANDLLQAKSIEDACARGCRYYHLGESGQSESLAHFKERFGAEPYDYAEYIVEKLPVTRVDAALRNVVKRAIGFKDR